MDSHPQFDGMRLLESESGHDELPLYFECTIFRRDRKVATSIREYMYEAHTGQGAWLTHPRRMLRHKAMVQCARICFGLGGVYEPDEAARISANTREWRSKSENKIASDSSDSKRINKTASLRAKTGPCGNESFKSWLKGNL